MTEDLANVGPKSNLDRLIAEAARYPLLSRDEECELTERYRDARDEEAARRLLGSHLRLVIKIARGYRGYGVALDEMIAVGNVGLMQALARFDPERGFRFATYAMWWIRAAMQEHILHDRSLVKMGTTAAQKTLFFNLRRLKQELGVTGDGDMAPEAVATIADTLQVSEDEVIDMDRRLAGADRSLSAPLRTDGETAWQDLLVDEGEDQESLVADASERAWRRDLLSIGLDTLNERERHILTMRRLSEEPLTLEDLSRVYGVSRERVRQIEARAFAKLQRAMLASAANANQHPLAA